MICDDLCWFVIEIIQSRKQLMGKFTNRTPYTFGGNKTRFLHMFLHFPTKALTELLRRLVTVGDTVFAMIAGEWVQTANQ